MNLEDEKMTYARMKDITRTYQKPHFTYMRGIWWWWIGEMSCDNIDKIDFLPFGTWADSMNQKEDTSNA